MVMNFMGLNPQKNHRIDKQKEEKVVLQTQSGSICRLGSKERGLQFFYTT